MKTRILAAALLALAIASPALAQGIGVGPVQPIQIPVITPPPVVAPAVVAPTTTVTTTAPATATQTPAASTTVTIAPSANPTSVVIPAPIATETPAWLNTIAMVGIAIIMGLVGFGLNIVNKKVGLENNANAMAIEGHARDALQSMLENLAGRAIVELGPKINTTILNIQNPTIRAIAQSAPDLAGSAMKLFGLSTDTIAQKIIDKIGVLTASNPSISPTSSAIAPSVTAA
jgi:hypothetical protein